VIDIGGGASRLVDRLLDRGVRCLTVLDISGAALARAWSRLPDAPVTWIEADVTGPWTAVPADLWHDRAVFHFLTEPADRARYLDRLTEVLKPAGQAVIATFALEGPPRCSGLPVVRYSPDTLAAELGTSFQLEDAMRESHATPAGGTQEFWYCRLRHAARLPGDVRAPNT
jgi:methyltransferase family protein